MQDAAPPPTSPLSSDIKKRKRQTRPDALLPRNEDIDDGVKGIFLDVLQKRSGGATRDLLSPPNYRFRNLPILKKTVPVRAEMKRVAVVGLAVFSPSNCLRLLSAAASSPCVLIEVYIIPPHLGQELLPHRPPSGRLCLATAKNLNRFVSLKSAPMRL